MRTIYRPVVQLDCCAFKFKIDVLKYQNIMNLHAFNMLKYVAVFAVCKQFRPRLDTTELLIYTRGETTKGPKRLVMRND